MIKLLHGRYWRLVFVAFLLLLVGGGLGARAADESQKTYIEFVFDASFSMNEEVEKGKSRMDVAKEVMIDLIQNLEDRPGLEVGLRVYGSRNTSCDDSVLVQDFGSVDAVRSNILGTVKGLKPKGKTPIAYSLEQAALDFPSRDSRNIIVLITDGQESCGGDPCAVSYYLQSQGIIYKPHVVGFAMSAAEESRVKCIGTYYSAKDRKSLSEALGSIMRKVVAPAELEVEAWAGGQNVTSKTVFTITDSSGNPLVDNQKAKGDVFRHELSEGTYGVRGVFEVGSMALEASQAKIKLGEGESKRVRLDFGEIEAKLEVEVTYRQANITSDTKLVITRQGKQEAAFGTGTQVFRHKGAPGQVDLKVTYAGDIPVEKQVSGINLDTGKTNKVTVELDDLLGTLRAKVVAGDKDVTLKSEVMANDGQHKVQLSPKGEYLVAILPADLYGVKATYQQSKSDLAEVTVGAGRVTDVTLEVDVPGKIVLVPMMDGKAIPISKVHAWFYVTPGKETSFDVKNDKLVATLSAGNYGIRAKLLDGVEQVRELKDIRVKSGEMKEVSIEFQSTGKLQVRLASGGKAHRQGRIMVYTAKEDFDVDAYVGDLEETERGVYELKLKEGSYDLELINLGEGFADKKLYDVQVDGGSTTEKVIELGGQGKLVVKMTSGGKAHRQGRIMVYTAKEDFDVDAYVGDLEETERGVYELKLKEGSYDLELINLGEGFADKKLYDVQVDGGSTTEKVIELGGQGKLVVKMTSGGKPHREGRIMVYTADEDFDADAYVGDAEDTERGVYELKIREGSYDLQLINLGTGFPDKNIYGIQVGGGSTTEKVIELGGMGKIRARLVQDHDYDWLRLVLNTADDGDYVGDLEEMDDGRWVLDVREGEYELEITNGFDSQWVRDITVEPGSTLDITVHLQLGDEEDDDW